MIKSVGVWDKDENLSKNNFLFFNTDAGIGDNLLQPFNDLYIYGQKKGVNFVTLDTIESLKKIDVFIFFDFPNMKNKYVKKVFKLDSPKYLVILESKIIKPDNWDLNNHKLFDKIFTWNDDFIDDDKYFKINFSSRFPNSIKKKINAKNKLCTLISGNKVVNHPLELYSKRIEAIRWFETNRPTDFDLYGMGWDEFKFTGPRIIRVLNKIKFLTRFLAASFPSYRGAVKEKKSTLEKYKFCICYENARDIPGYITEKIFDCFVAGCVPIYWGANNVERHIPKDCFIDKKKFHDYEALYQHIKNMNDNEYIQYLECIEIFLNSESIKQFSTENFSQVIVSNI